MEDVAIIDRDGCSGLVDALCVAFRTSEGSTQCHAVVLLWVSYLVFPFRYLASTRHLRKQATRAQSGRVVPLLAVFIDLLIESFSHWPPNRWWPIFMTGLMPVPSRYIFGVPIEAWDGYLYSLWPNAFMALAAGTSFLIALRALRSKLAFERTRRE
jgi:hypothetical protein